MNAADEEEAGYRPCLILAHADPVYAAQVVRAFRRHGWDVYPAKSGPQVRGLARILDPQLVLLQADLPGESGWLTCDKLIGEFPRCKVVLVAAGLTPTLASFAEFVGASELVDHRDCLAALLDQVREPALPSVS